jgi:hypothetical protein
LREQGRAVVEGVQKVAQAFGQLGDQFLVGLGDEVGEEFGWYPYQNEPWHWEFNPPGFRKIYWADFLAGAPEREIIMVEP